MDTETFSPSEVENLQRLIEENQTPNKNVKDDQIKDADIIFFSQFGHLNGSSNDANFQILQGLEETENAAISENFTITPEQLNQELEKSGAAFQFLTNAPDGSIKKEPLSNFAHTKYKELDGKSTKVFECGICGKEFGHQYTLMRHLPTHTDERKFHCHTCGKSFRQMSTLSQHRAIHSAERPYICEICSKTFNRVSTLISHRKTHTGLKPHRCHLCNKAFHQKGNLRNHIFTHTNERPYKCEICNKGFNQMSNLMCHKMKTHQQTDAYPKYKCRVCCEIFLKRVSLRQHEQYKHGLVTNGTPKVPSLDYSNAIIVDPITTDAMKMAMKSSETPFALLRPLSGIPVLVRVLPAGQKQMLVPATADDLKKYGHISIKPRATDEAANEAEAADAQKANGCVVQIKVPVVATVIQKSGGANGPFSMNVVSPGPSASNISELNSEHFVYTSTLTENNEISGSSNPNGNSLDGAAYNGLMPSVADAEIEFIDQSGNIVNEYAFKEKVQDVNSMEFSFDEDCQNGDVNSQSGNLEGNEQIIEL